MHETTFQGVCKIMFEEACPFSISLNFYPMRHKVININISFFVIGKIQSGSNINYRLIKLVLKTYLVLKKLAM